MAPIGSPHRNSGGASSHANVASLQQGPAGNQWAAGAGGNQYQPEPIARPVQPIAIRGNLLSNYLLSNYLLRYRHFNPPHASPTGTIIHGDIIEDKSPGIPVRWPRNTVMYELDDKFPVDFRATVKKHFDRLLRLTDYCVSFVEATPSKSVPLLTITSYPGCCSHLGFGSGLQRSMNLEMPKCSSQPVVLHELMHILGFGHEHSRPDRDRFIRLNRNRAIFKYDIWDKITEVARNEWNEPVMKRIVEKYPYDYGSVTHYYAEEASQRPWQLGWETITARDSSKDVYLQFRYDNTTLSMMDIIKVKKFYGCR